ncbi:chemotaxis protein CheX [bacterium]|nr:chemotaxis protein CheX [bacterium]
MKAEYVNPFIEAVYELFSTVLSTEVKRGELGIVQEMGQPRDITALIGFSGPARGMAALSFPVTTALSMVSRVRGTETRVVDESVMDFVAELVNAVAGIARARLAKSGAPIDLALPTVVRGVRYAVDYPSQSHWLDVPFASALGPFRLRVTLEIADLPQPQARA